MESSDEDLSLELLLPSFPFPDETSSDERNSNLNEMLTKNKYKSTAGDVSNINGDKRNSFSLATKGLNWRLEGMAQDRQRKNRKQPSRGPMVSLSDEKLEKMSIHDLNKQLRQLPKGLIQRYRRRRRILKNRKYALKSRKKGSEKTINIAEQNAALELEICQAKEKLTKVTNERDEYKQKFAQLKAMFPQSSIMALSSKRVFK